MPFHPWARLDSVVGPIDVCGFFVKMLLCSLKVASTSFFEVLQWEGPPHSFFIQQICVNYCSAASSEETPQLRVEWNRAFVLKELEVCGGWINGPQRYQVLTLENGHLTVWDNGDF